MASTTEGVEDPNRSQRWSQSRPETSYRDYRDRYRAMAESLGFEGHMKWADAMT
jgi:lipocalin